MRAPRIEGPAAARLASSVVLVRPSPDGRGWQTYLLRRSAQSPVLADLWVFPGGTVRADDLDPSNLRMAPSFSPNAAHAQLSRPPGHPPVSPAESIGLYFAAARELFEEAGVLLSEDAPPTAFSAERRRAVEQGSALRATANELGLSLHLEWLLYYAHWITPEAAPQRFDTRFFIAQLPPDQVATPSPFEMTEGMWIDVPEALRRNREGQLPLHFATMNHLRRIAPFQQLDDLLDFAASKAVVSVMPNTRSGDGKLIPWLPDELKGNW